MILPVRVWVDPAITFELRIMELGLGFGGSGLGVGGVGFGGRGLGFRIEGLGSRDWVSGCRSEELGVGN